MSEFGETRNRTNQQMDPPPFPVVRDFLPDFQLPDAQLQPQSLLSLALGQPVVMIFCPQPASTGGRDMLTALDAAAAELHAKATIVPIVGADLDGLRALAGRLPGLVNLLGDPQGVVIRGYGAAGHQGCSVVVADRNRRIRRVDHGVSDPAYITALNTYLDGFAEPTPAEMSGFAPVLFVPDVLEPDFRDHLMAVHDADNEPSGVLSTNVAGESSKSEQHDIKRRSDHYVRDRSLIGELHWRIGRRVLPEIFKYSWYRVTQIEEYKIVCYDSEGGGYFKPHRDGMSSAGAHRRFAMTLNLNTGAYQGGHLRFPEYGPGLYRPGAGDAVIFGCSLLHEAMPVTAGKRYVLLSFLYGEDGKVQRAESRSGEQGGGV